MVIDDGGVAPCNVRRRRAWGAFLLATALSSSVSVPFAVNAQSVAVGSRVRVRVARRPYEGKLVGVRQDTLFVRMNEYSNTDSYAQMFLLRAVQSVDVSVGRRRRVIPGALLGGLGGWGVAGLVAFVNCGVEVFCNDRVGKTEYISAAAVGVVLGSLFGALPQNIWRGVDPTQLPKVAVGGDTQRGFVRVGIGVGGPEHR